MSYAPTTWLGAHPPPRNAALGRRPGTTNGCVMRVVGMSRSGNHAIIGWILAQHPGSWLFLNCVEPETSPFASARPLDDGRCFRTNIGHVPGGGVGAVGNWPVEATATSLA